MVPNTNYTVWMLLNHMELVIHWGVNEILLWKFKNHMGERELVKRKQTIERVLLKQIGQFVCMCLPPQKANGWFWATCTLLVQTTSQLLRKIREEWAISSIETNQLVNYVIVNIYKTKMKWESDRPSEIFIRLISLKRSQGHTLREGSGNLNSSTPGGSYFWKD